jgi:hypothetical protein
MILNIQAALERGEKLSSISELINLSFGNKEKKNFLQKSFKKLHFCCIF